MTQHRKTGQPTQHSERPGYGVTAKFPTPADPTEADAEDQEDDA